MQTPQPHQKPAINHDIIYLFLLLIFSVYICWPLFKEDFITTGDGGGHLLHLYCMEHFIGKGQWYPRWIPDLWGYGYPLFNFYPPLLSIVGTALVKTGFSFIWALNMTCFLFVLFSAFTMYLFAKELWGEQGGFLSATAYLFVPYQMTDLYVRGAYAESASFAFLPLILWGFLKLRKDPDVFYISITGFSVAGLCLTHNCIALVFCPIIILYILTLHFPDRVKLIISTMSFFKNFMSFFKNFLSFPRKRESIEGANPSQNYMSLLISLMTFGLGIGLACFFWLPALVEKNFVHFEKLLNGSLGFHSHFLSIRQLIYSPWPKKPGDSMSLQIGPMHGFIAIASLCFIQKITKGRKLLMRQLLFLTFMLIAAIFLTLPVSVTVWEHIKVLQFVQHPGRLLVIITFIISVLSGGITLISAKHRLTIMILGVSAIFFMNFSHCYPPYGSNKVNLKNIDPSFVLRYLHPQDGGEFIPIWVKEIRPLVPLEKLEIIIGRGRMLSHRGIDELHQSFTVETKMPSLLCFNAFYFPGWTVKVDGHPVDILKDNPFGLIIFSVNEGVHDIKADFGTTPVRRLAVAVSLISFLILLSLFLLSQISWASLRGAKRRSNL